MNVSMAASARTKLPEHNLDVLRAIAVLLVLIDHTIESRGLHTKAIQWMGIAGVQAFFVHTSLVLMSSLERDEAPERTGWIKRFYVRRALRIYPLVWFVIALALIFRIPRGLIPAAWESPTVLTVVANVLLVQDVAGLPNMQVVMWSLPIELQMYVVLPLFYLVARGRQFWPMMLLVGLAFALMALYAWGTNPDHRVQGMWRLPVMQYAPSFSMGVLAYHLLRRRTGVGELSSHVWLPYVLLVVAGAGAFAVTQGHLWLTRVAMCALIGMAIPLVRDSATSVVTRVAHTIAVYSYGIYLLHMSALRLGFSFFSAQPVLVQWTIFIVTLVIGSYAAYHLVEKPGIALGKWLLGERQKSATLEASAPVP